MRQRKLQRHIARDVSLGVAKGECLGLLGPNGAGKTTTMSVITGDTRADRGAAYLAAHNIVGDASAPSRSSGAPEKGGKKNLPKQSLASYCPQFDALFDELSPREHLTLYALLKGIPASKVSTR